MNFKEIADQITKWEDESFLEDIRRDLCDYVNGLDKILSERYGKIIQKLNPNEKEQALGRLQRKNMFDNNINYIGNVDIVKFDRNEKVANGGYINGKIIVNPDSAKQFYASYMDFANGKVEGIRDLDYSKQLSELKDLSPLEVLYWYYFNKKTYQDFLKSTMLHESVHRWTLEATMFDFPIDIFALEGFVEKEARYIAEENNLEYAKCFRKDELAFIDTLLEGILNEDDSAMVMLCLGNAEACLIFVMRIKIFMEIEGISQDKAGKLAKSIYIELMDNMRGYPTKKFGKNYREIFAGMKTDISQKTINIIEAKIESEKEMFEKLTLGNDTTVAPSTNHKR